MMAVGIEPGDLNGDHRVDRPLRYPHEVIVLGRSVSAPETDGPPSPPCRPMLLGTALGMPAEIVRRGMLSDANSHFRPVC